MVGSVGEDDFANMALAPLAEAGVDLTGVVRRPGHTGIAMISVDPSGENQIVAANGANLGSLATQLNGEQAWGTTLLVQMETEPVENWAAIRAAHERGVRTILNVAPAAPVPGNILEILDVVVVNELEATGLAAELGTGGNDVVATAKRIVDAGTGTVIVTLGEAGAVARTADGGWRIGVPPIDVIDTVGAGDSFVGSLTAALDRGYELPVAFHRAAIAGSLACRKLGAQSSIPHAAEIDEWRTRLAPPDPL
jgi:Sugar kinases, ribokinase family